MCGQEGDHGTEDDCTDEEEAEGGGAEEDDKEKVEAESRKGVQNTTACTVRYDSIDKTLRDRFPLVKGCRTATYAGVYCHLGKSHEARIKGAYLGLFTDVRVSKLCLLNAHVHVGQLSELLILSLHLYT